MVTDSTGDTPPQEWRREWEQRVRLAAPEQLNLGDGRATSYWPKGTGAAQANRLRTFGHLPTVLLDTFLLFIAEVVLNLVLGAAALFTIVINGHYLDRTGSVNTALSRATTSLSDWLTSPAGIACSALATQLAIVLILYLRLVRRGIMNWADLGFGPTLRRDPLRALAIGVGLGLLAFAVGEALLAIMHTIGLDVQEQQKSLQAVRHASLFEVVPFAVATALTAPVAEEAFFRGYALRALTVRYGLPIGLVVSSVLFAILHLAGGVGWVAVPLFVVGLILGWGYARTGNLLTNITAHALNNAIGVILLYTST